MLSKSVDSSARSTSSRIISSDKQKFANQSLDALKKNVKFVWGKEQEAAMQKIKAKIAESGILRIVLSKYILMQAARMQSEQC
jgi:hypothetical protein